MATTKKTASKGEVATIESDKPAYLQALEQQGAVKAEDNFDSSDIVVPRVKLLQGLSTECEQFDDAKAGRFWHTGFDMNLGEHVDFVVCSRKKKYLLVAPLEDGQGILARAEDFTHWDRTGSWEVKIGKNRTVTWAINDLEVKKSGLDQWGTSDPEDEDSPPAATMFYEYLVLLPDHLDMGPAVLSLTRSQIRKAKKGLNDKIKLHQSAGRPMQSLVFRAAPTDDKNSEGQSFKNFHFTSNGFASEDLYNQAIELKDMLATYRVADEEDAYRAESEGEAKAESKDF